MGVGCFLLIRIDTAAEAAEAREVGEKAIAQCQKAIDVYFAAQQAGTALRLI